MLLLFWHYYFGPFIFPRPFNLTGYVVPRLPLVLVQFLFIKNGFFTRGVTGPGPEIK